MKLFENYIKNKDDDFFKKLLNLKNKIEKKIKENEDFEPFIVGDRIKVWDGSYNIDKFTKQCRHGIDELFTNNIGIVIETGCNKIYSDEILKSMIVNYKDEILDILISINDAKIYISSKCIKHI